MSKHLIDSDPMTRQKQVAHVGHDGSLGIESKQDVEAIVDRNKLERKNDSGSWEGHRHKVASIPNVVWWDLKRRGIADNEERLRKWLNDPDNRAFRTKPGKV